jgi:curved DNA-binding protein CbpA
MTPTQELVLDCYRSPHLLRSLSDTSIPLPEGIDGVMRAAIAAETAANDVGEAIAATPAELRQATLLFVKNVVLTPGADHYRVLGLRFNATFDQIDTHYRLLLALLQLDAEASTRDLVRYVTRISRAYSVLGEERRRHSYDKARFGALVDDSRWDFPVVSLVNGLLADRVLEQPNAGVQESGLADAPAAGAPTPASNPVVLDAAAAACDEPRPPSRYRGPSNRMLLGLSAAALVAIVVASPRIADRFTLWLDEETAKPTAPTAPAVVASGASTPTSPAGPAVDWSAVEREGTLKLWPDMFPVRTGTLGDAIARPVPFARPPDSGIVMSAPLPRGADNSAVAAATSGRVQAHVSTSSVKPKPAASAGKAPSSTPGKAQAAQPSVLRQPLSKPPAPVAAAASPSAGAIPTVPIKPIDSYDLERLVERLATVYAEGDAAGLEPLFAENARSNDQADRIGIVEEYSDLFAATERRSLRLDELQWRRDGEQVIGQGRFTVRLKPKWRSREEVLSGRVTLEVQRQQDGLVIVGMFHDNAPPRP